jgi:hypothetical protein
MRRATRCQVADCRRMRADTQRTSSPASSAESRALARLSLPRTVLTWLAEVITGRTTAPHLAIRDRYRYFHVGPRLAWPTSVKFPCARSGDHDRGNARVGP